MRIGSFVLFYRDPDTNHDTLAESGIIMEHRGPNELVRMYSTEDMYIEEEIPRALIIEARTVWTIKGSPFTIDHRPLVAAVFVGGFLWEWFLNG